MERLTERCPEGIRIKGCSTLYADEERKSAPASNAIVRLAAYEDTDLEPEEILTGKELAEVACAVNLLKEYQAIGPIDRFREIALAEKDRRLMVLPCKVGDVVYAITSSTNIDGLENEETIDIFECKVESVTFYSKRNTQFRLFYQGVFVAVFVTVDDFGKTVFLTREEAEAALKRKEEEDNAAN